MTLLDPRQWAADVVVKRPLYNEGRRAAGEPQLVEREANTKTRGGEGNGGIDEPNVREEGF